ncbi:radical SAM protein [bacterium]|nr:radical SAM protein [bacterium]
MNSETNSSIRLAEGLPEDFDPDLSWVDEFVAQIKDFIFVRKADGLLIILPNQTYKLNRSGLDILSRLCAGETLTDVLDALLEKRQVRLDLFYFFLDLKAVISGCMSDNEGRMAVEKIPYAPPIGTLPVLSEIAVTYSCNLRCAFCYAGSCPERTETMSLEECKRVIDVIRHDAQVPSVSFTGGEPVLVPWLVDAVVHAKSLGMRVNLITNGTLINERLTSKLKGAGLDSAQVSLEGPNARVHDEITSSTGSFNKSVNAIKLLQAADIHVHANTTINKKNLPFLKEHLPLYKSLDLDRYSMNLMIPCGHGATQKDLWVRYSEIGPIVREMKKEARDMGLKFLWYSPTPLCMFNPIPLGLGNKACAACDGLLSIAPDGGVLPCSSWAEPVGNILDEPFEKVWESARAKWIRAKKYAPPECRDCSELKVCQAACPLYWDAVGTGELTKGTPS